MTKVALLHVLVVLEYSNNEMTTPFALAFTKLNEIHNYRSL